MILKVALKYFYVNRLGLESKFVQMKLDSPQLLIYVTLIDTDGYLC